MTSHRMRHICVLATAAILVSACAPKEPPKATPVATPAAQPETMDMVNRVMAIQAGISELTAATAQLPGYAEGTREAEAVNRKLMHRCFDTLTQVLPIAEGPSPSQGFRVDMKILETSRSQLDHMASTSSAEPAIIQGLRVMPHLLTQINEHTFASDAGLQSKIEALQKTVTKLDVSAGVDSRIISAQAMREATEALRWMDENLSSRLAPSTAPATQPVMTHPVATTQPSTPK